MRLKIALVSLFLLALSACGGGGGGGADATASPPPQSRNMVFLGDIRNFQMGAIDTLTLKQGTLTAKIFSTDATDWLDAAFDGTRDELYVAALGQIDVYANASKLDGTIKATRTIRPIPSLFGSIVRVILDKDNDRLYASFNAGQGGLAVFEQASKLSGAVAPSRIMYGPFDANNFALDLKRNVMYSCWRHLDPCQIFTFEHLDTANGNIDITRRIFTPGHVTGFAMDSGRDRLYLIADRGGINILDGASTATGNPPTAWISLPSRNSGSAITIDAVNDRLYAGFEEQAFVLEGASKLTNGSATTQALAITAAGASFSYFAVRQ